MWNDVIEKYNPDKNIRKSLNTIKSGRVLFRIPFTWYFVVKVEKFNMKKLMIATKEFNAEDGTYYYQLV